MESLHDARIKAGMATSDLARLLGYPVRTIEDWDQGRREIPPFVKKRIIEELMRIAEKNSR